MYVRGAKGILLFNFLCYASYLLYSDLKLANLECACGEFEFEFKIVSIVAFKPLLSGGFDGLLFKKYSV